MRPTEKVRLPDQSWGTGDVTRARKGSLSDCLSHEHPASLIKINSTLNTRDQLKTQIYRVINAENLDITDTIAVAVVNIHYQNQKSTRINTINKFYQYCKNPDTAATNADV